MEIPTIFRPILKTNIRAWTWRLIFIICLAQIIAYTSMMTKTPHGRSTAPGAHNAPGLSRFGKSESPHPGASFQSFRFFKHNAFSNQAGQAKLIPYQHKQNIIPFPCIWSKAFNIILIISQTNAKDYSGFSCATIIHKLSTLIPQLGNRLDSGLQNKLLWLLKVSGANRNAPILA